MKILKSVKIGGINYDVNVTKEAVALGNALCYGTIDYDACEIAMDAKLPIQVLEHTLLHEIFHGIVNDRKIPIDSEKEEEIVEAFASGVHALIKDNPKLFI